MNLYDAHLAGATLREARLGQADLSSADLRQADLTGALGLERARLAGAIYDGRTRWPKGFDPARHGAVKKE